MTFTIPAPFDITSLGSVDNSSPFSEQVLKVRNWGGVKTYDSFENHPFVSITDCRRVGNSFSLCTIVENEKETKFIVTITWRMIVRQCRYVDNSKQHRAATRAKVGVITLNFLRLLGILFLKTSVDYVARICLI